MIMNGGQVMKKIVCAMLCIGALGFMMIGCGNHETVSKEEYDALKQQMDEATARLDEIQKASETETTITDNTEVITEEDVEEVSTGNKENTESERIEETVSEISQNPVISFTGSDIEIEDGFEVLSDYTYYYSGLDGIIEHIIVIKNNTDRNVEINSSSVIYSRDGNMIGLCDSDSGCGIAILGAGETSAIHECNSEKISEEVGHYSTKVSVSDSKKTPIYGGIVYSITTNPSNVIIEATNNSDVTIDTLMACFIFFKDGELSDFDRVHFDADEIKPGDTVYGDTSSYKEYDAVNLYFYGD